MVSFLILRVTLLSADGDLNNNPLLRRPNEFLYASICDEEKSECYGEVWRWASRRFRCQS